MNRKTLLLLIVGFAVLIVIALLQTQPGAVFRPEATLSAYRIMGQELNMTAADLIGVRLRDLVGGGSLTLSRDSAGQWSIEGLGSSDPQAASNIVKTVVLLPFQSTIPIESNTNLADFGFAPQGILSIEMVRQDGRTHAIAVGGLTAARSAYYAVADTLTQIYVLERAAVDYLIVQFR
ncbi:MAG: hypothetical protein JNM70_07675 [Anaerolineae bacterium]|nr:hypothetical protein [Anaerolineae bacterium]